MGVVQDAVADGVGERGVGEVVVPLGRRQLARDDRRAVADPSRRRSSLCQNCARTIGHYQARTGTSAAEAAGQDAEVVANGVRSWPIVPVSLRT